MAKISINGLEVRRMSWAIEEKHGLSPIWNYAFNDCRSLNDVAIGNGIRVVGYCAFANCIYLSTVIIRRGIKIISAFANCGSLVKFNIDITEIFGYHAYDGLAIGKNGKGCYKPHVFKGRSSLCLAEQAKIKKSGCKGKLWSQSCLLSIEKRVLWKRWDVFVCLFIYLVLQVGGRKWILQCNWKLAKKKRSTIS